MNVCFPRVTVAVAAVGLFSLPLLGGTTTYHIDPKHSDAQFAVTHLMISTVRGEFHGVNSTVVYDNSDPSRSSVEATIDATTVDTREPDRDKHLKSADFFDVAQYPTATFVSTSVAKGASGLTVNGNLTLHGVTRPVTLDVAGPTGPVNGGDHKPHMGFSATTTISRSTFNLGSKFPAAVLGDDVKLSIDLDVARQ
jgi:polyisoprenoid-binding protein YceI